MSDSTFSCFCSRSRELADSKILRTVEGELLPTFQAVATARGLCDSDEHYHVALRDVLAVATAARARRFLAMILICCEVADPFCLWDTFAPELREDFRIRYPDVVADSNSSPCSICKNAWRGVGKLLPIMGFHYPELLTRMLTEHASCARNEIMTLRTKKARPLAWRRACMIIPSNCTRIWS